MDSLLLFIDFPSIDKNVPYENVFKQYYHLGLFGERSPWQSCSFIIHKFPRVNPVQIQHNIRSKRVVDCTSYVLWVVTLDMAIIMCTWRTKLAGSVICRLNTIAFLYAMVDLSTFDEIKFKSNWLENYGVAEWTLCRWNDWRLNLYQQIKKTLSSCM